MNEDDRCASACVGLIDLIGGDARYGVDHETALLLTMADGALDNPTRPALIPILLPLRAECSVPVRGRAGVGALVLIDVLAELEGLVLCRKGIDVEFLDGDVGGG